MLGSAVDAV